MLKQEERFVIERFLSTLDPGSQWVLRDHERPDFVASTALRRVGIEHSALHWDSRGEQPRQEGEALRNRICEQARRQWLLGPRPHIEVGMTFDPWIRLRKAEVAGIAERLVAFVGANLPADGKMVVLDNPWQNPPTWPKEVDSLWISRLVPYDTTYWHATDGGFIPPLTIEHLQRRIDAKNRLAAGYAPFDELWLVLSMHGTQLSSMFTVPDSTATATYQTVFGRTFLFECVGRKLTELNLHASDRDIRRDA